MERLMFHTKTVSLFSLICQKLNIKAQQRFWLVFTCAGRYARFQTNNDVKSIVWPQVRFRWVCFLYCWNFSIIQYTTFTLFTHPLAKLTLGLVNVSACWWLGYIYDNLRSIAKSASSIHIGASTTVIHIRCRAIIVLHVTPCFKRVLNKIIQGQ